MSNLKLIKATPECFWIENKKEEHLGQIVKGRVGTYMHWVFEPMSDTYFSAGCMDEIREFMKNPHKALEQQREVKMNLKDKTNHRITQAKYMKFTTSDYEEIKEGVQEAVKKMNNSFYDIEDDECSNSELEIKYTLMDKFKEIFGDWEE